MAEQFGNLMLDSRLPYNSVYSVCQFSTLKIGIVYSDLAGML